MINFLISINFKRCEPEFLRKPESLIEINSEDKILYLWGDPLNYREFKLTSNTDEKMILEEIIGHFYYVLCDKKNRKCSIGNSVFSILPVYYSVCGELTYFSNHVIPIADKIHSPRISKRFILENVLFNYPLFNHSCFTEIKLLAVNSSMQCDGVGCVVKEILQIEDYFETNPASWKTSSDKIAELFLERAAYYFPNEEYFTSLTAGFDGRTLTAASLFHKKKFSAFSFGRSDSNDVLTAKNLSDTAGINYRHVNLNDDYVRNKSFESGKLFVTNSSGTAGFSRAHYLFSANELKRETKYIITGNFGSELFRSAHLSGVMVSNNLKKLFMASDFDEGVKELENCPEWNSLNKAEFTEEWKSLVNDLKNLPCFNPDKKRFSKNMQFYIIIFNEVFRKYFGAEMVNQYSVLINRTPFLDLKFVKELLKTELAGVYSDFLTSNPVKRFKGQVVYAKIINKSFPVFGKINTDKGYKPEDLLSPGGKVRISVNYLRKKLLRNKTFSEDNQSVNAAFECNGIKWAKEIMQSKLFNPDFISEGLRRKYRNRDSFFISLSQLWWHNYLNKHYAKKG